MRSRVVGVCILACTVIGCSESSPEEPNESHLASDASDDVNEPRDSGWALADADAKSEEPCPTSIETVHFFSSDYTCDDIELPRDAPKSCEFASRSWGPCRLS